MFVENDFAYDFAKDADTVNCIFCKKIVPTDHAIWLGTINIRREKMYACGCTTPKDDEMRYTLFACDETGGHQMRSDSDLELLKRAADDLKTQAINNGDGIDYVVKVAYRVVYRGRVVQER